MWCLYAATLSDSAIPFYSSQLVDHATGNAEPLEPRLSLTANKCEGKRCEQLHLMIFGGTSDDTVIAETTLGKHIILQQNNTMCSSVFTGIPYLHTVDSFDFHQKTMRVYKP